MTGEDALADLLGRIGAARDGTVFLDDAQLQDWPSEAVTAMEAAGLLSPASPATSVICPGCEEQCTMPVHMLLAAGAPADAFVVCDKLPHINRVPVELDSLKRWHASGEAVAALLARLLNLRRTVTSTAYRRWEVGALKGTKGSSHLVLHADGVLTLSIAGHTLALADVLTLRGDQFLAKSRVLIDCVNHPAAGGGAPESAAQRRERLAGRLEELRRAGHRDFLRRLSREEDISPRRITQILAKGSPPSSKSGRSRR